MFAAFHARQRMREGFFPTSLVCAMLFSTGWARLTLVLERTQSWKILLPQSLLQWNYKCSKIIVLNGNFSYVVWYIYCYPFDRSVPFRQVIQICKSLLYSNKVTPLWIAAMVFIHVDDKWLATKNIWIELFSYEHWQNIWKIPILEFNLIWKRSYFYFGSSKCPENVKFNLKAKSFPWINIHKK